MENTLFHYYIWLGACYSSYLAGLYNGKGMTGFQHFLAAVVYGAAWPAAAVWSAWLAYVQDRKGGA